MDHNVSRHAGIYKLEINKKHAHGSELYYKVLRAVAARITTWETEVWPEREPTPTGAAFDGGVTDVAPSVRVERPWDLAVHG